MMGWFSARPTDEEWEILARVGIFKDTQVMPDTMVILAKNILDLKRRVAALETRLNDA